MKLCTLGALLASTLILCGCSKEEPASPPISTTNDVEPSTDPAPDTDSVSWILTSAPENMLSVTQAKAQAKEGDEIVIRGRIGGRHTPIQSDSTVFTIVDVQLEYCGQTTEDRCRAPWDYCCETPATIANNSATIQALSDSVIDLTSELEPLDIVILQGVVGPRPSDEVLMISTKAIYTEEG